MNNYGFNPVPGKKVTLISAYKSMFQNYANFSGRARRCEYWLAALANAIIITVALMISFVLIDDGAEDSMEAFGSVFAGLSLVFGYGLIIIIPSLALTVRRLHDTGKSGWFVLINLIPVVGFVIFFVVLCLEGTNGINKYGNNPKEK